LLRWCLEVRRNFSSKQQRDWMSGGTALWIFSSFMNHSNRKTSAHAMAYGKLKVTFASRAIKAGEEVTISYSNDAEHLLNHWGIRE